MQQDDSLIKEWEKYNKMGTSGCRGAVMLRLTYMDKIAKQIGYPMSKDVYLSESLR